MEKQNGKELEELIRGSVFRNPGHKKSLLKRLGEIERTVELGADDLEGVAGGAPLPVTEEWEAWPELPQKRN